MREVRFPHSYPPWDVRWVCRQPNVYARKKGQCVNENLTYLSSVQFSRSVVSDSLQPNELQHARPPCPSATPEFTQSHAHRVGDAIQPSHPLSSPSPPAPNPSQHQGFSNESTLHMRWPKYWSFSFSLSPSNEHPGLVSFRMDWLNLLAPRCSQIYIYI